jgi:DNA-binding NarL/FixJ family response regulator
VFSSDHAANSDDLLQKVTKYIRSVEEDLSLYPPSNVIDDKKKEIVRNLHLSGISEDMIADQLDIDINTVRMVIQEISTL